MRSLSTLLVASLLSLGACLVQPGPGGPPPVGHPMGPAPEPGPTMISGQVVDAQTHQGLDKVALDFSVNGGKALGTIVTDATGHYQTPAIEPGEYGLRIRREQYQMIERPSIMVHRGNNDMTFEMVHR